MISSFNILLCHRIVVIQWYIQGFLVYCYMTCVHGLLSEAACCHHALCGACVCIISVFGACACPAEQPMLPKPWPDQIFRPGHPFV